MNEVIAPGDEPERQPSRAVAKADRNAAVANRADPMNMIAAAIQKGLGIEVIKEIVALQERLDATNARKAFDAALAAAKEELPIILKNARVKYDAKRSDGKVDYAHETLAQIAEQIDPILSRHGLSYRFRTSQPVVGHVTVTCIISHELGHFEENPLTAAFDVGAGKNHLQALASSVSYLSRYTLKAALGLAAAEADGDDDGQAGGGTRKNPPVPSASASGSAPSAVTATSTQSSTEPYNLPTKDMKFAVWGKLYIEKIKTADTVDVLMGWDRQNNDALQAIYDKDQAVYAEIDKAFLTHKNHLEQKAKPKRPDSISTGRPAAGTTDAPAPIEGMPDITDDTQYEDWLKWAYGKLAEQIDADVLEIFFNQFVDQVKPRLFPPDYDKLTAAYQAKHKALTTQ